MVKHMKLGDLVMPRDVITCWNSTYDMVKFALEFRTAIDMMSATSGALRHYVLTDEEWEIVA